MVLLVVVVDGVVVDVVVVVCPMPICPSSVGRINSVAITTIAATSNKRRFIVSPMKDSYPIYISMSISAALVLPIYDSHRTVITGPIQSLEGIIPRNASFIKDLRGYVYCLTAGQ